jgi:hypothetical protein
MTSNRIALAERYGWTGGRITLTVDRPEDRWRKITEPIWPDRHYFIHTSPIINVWCGGGGRW